MTANRTPGAFTAEQRESLERMASLTAAAVELVAAKQSEADSVEVAERASAERERMLRAVRLRDDLDERLAHELADHRGIDDLLGEAASVIGGPVAIHDAQGGVIAAAGDGESTQAAVGSAPLIGAAGPGAVHVRSADAEIDASLVAAIVARYASIALIYDRSLDDIRHFHENELVGALLASNGPERSASSSAMIHRALGADGRVCIAVMVDGDTDESIRRRLLTRVRSIAQRGHTIVARHLGRIVIVSRHDEPELRTRIEPLIHEFPFFCGVALAAKLAEAPHAYDEAAGIAASMRALDRPGILAGAAEAGIAGLLLRSGDPAMARRFIDAHLGRLDDGARGDALRATALAYLDAHGVVGDAARVLHLHPNTVRQRLDRIDTALGTSWREGAHRLDVHVALRLWRLSRDVAGESVGARKVMRR